MATKLWRQRLTQQHQRQHEVQERQPGRDKSGSAKAEPRELGTDPRTKHEAHPDGGPHQAHVLGALRGGRYISDIGLRGRNTARKQPGKSPCSNKCIQAEGKAGRNKGRRGSQQANQKYRPSPNSVREPTQQRSAHQLRNREGRKQQADFRRARTKMQRIKRHQRQDDAKPQQV